MKSVAIIGAGITGLTAAFRLQRESVPVTVYEAAPRAGGLIQSIRQDGYIAECGPNSILETSPKVKELVNDLDLGGRRVESNLAAEKRYIVRGGKLRSMPSSALGFVGNDLFSWPAKIRLGAEPFIRPLPESEDESVAEFVLRRLGPEFLDYAIDPLVAGIYAGDARRLSVKHAFPKLHALEQKYGSLILGQVLGARERKRRREVSKSMAKKFSFDTGLETITETLAGKLDMRLNSTINGLRPADEDWDVSFRRGSREFTETHSAVLFTGPAYALPSLGLERDHADFTAFANIYYPPVASVVLGYRREDVEHPLDGFGFLVPGVEQCHILGTIFSSTLFPNRAPDGHVLLTSYIGGARAPELARLEQKQLFKLVEDDLRKLVGIRGEPTFESCSVFPMAIPQFEVGYGRVKKLIDEVEAEAPGFFLAGTYRGGISIADSIVSGDLAAERVNEFLRRPREAHAASESLVHA